MNFTAHEESMSVLYLTRTAHTLREEGVESPHRLGDLETLTEHLLIYRQWLGGAGEATVHVELPGEQMVRQLRETLCTKWGQ